MATEMATPVLFVLKAVDSHKLAARTARSVQKQAFASHVRSDDKPEEAKEHLHTAISGAHSEALAHVHAGKLKRARNALRTASAYVERYKNKYGSNVNVEKQHKNVRSAVRGPGVKQRGKILNTMHDLEAQDAPGALLSIRKVRAQHPNMPKQHFDSAMMKLHHSGKISLHHHDFPDSLPKEDRDKLVQHRGVHYVGAVVSRPKTEKALPQLIVKAAKPKAKEWPKDVDIGYAATTAAQHIVRDEGENSHERGGHVFGDNKVFIAGVHQRLKSHGYPHDLGQFKHELTEAHSKGSVKLSRADLVEAMPRKHVQDSETHHPGGIARFHFVRAKSLAGMQKAVPIHLYSKLGAHSTVPEDRRDSAWHKDAAKIHTAMEVMHDSPEKQAYHREQAAEHEAQASALKKKTRSKAKSAPAAEPQAAKPAQEAPKKSAEDDAKDFEHHFDAAHAKERRSGGLNLVSLDKLRDHVKEKMPHLSHEEFNHHLYDLRKKNKYVMQPAENRQGQLTDHQKQSAIHEDGRTFVYASKRETEKAMRFVIGGKA